MKLTQAVIDSQLTVNEAANIFRATLDKRPMKFKLYKLTYSTPASTGNPFSILNDPDWAFEVLADLVRGTAQGVIYCGIADDGNRRSVVLRSGDRRFGLVTAGLHALLVDTFVQRDSSANVSVAEVKGW